MVIGSTFSRSGLKCARPLGHDASVQLQRQILLMLVLVRRQPRARRDPGRSKTQKRGHVLDQTHEHDFSGGGLLVL